MYKFDLLPPTPVTLGKWRFLLGFPMKQLRDVILVVTICILCWEGRSNAPTSTTHKWRRSSERLSAEASERMEDASSLWCPAEMFHAGCFFPILGIPYEKDLPLSLIYLKLDVNVGKPDLSTLKSTQNLHWKMRWTELGNHHVLQVNLGVCDIPDGVR